ncbi:MAG TPA: hypothetical protein VEI47_09490 [Gemmatimonadales bacterium]|nr:hypothetical protein [Gemmatimonadales bacterium]
MNSRPNSTAFLPHAEDLVWRAMLVLGGVLTFVGALDLGALWTPASLGSASWTFGTTSTLFDLFPQFGLGIILLVAGAVALEQRGAARVLATVCIAVSLALWAAAYLYLDALPYVLQVPSAPAVHAVVVKGAVKAAVQVVVYPQLLVLVAVRAWSANRSIAAD